MGFVQDVVSNTAATVRDHKKSIAFILLNFAVLFTLILIARILIDGNPTFLEDARGFSQSYGLFGGFIIAAIGSLWFIPFPFEVVIAPILRLYNPAVVAIVFIAMGSALADIFNFYSGRKIGEKLIRKHVEKATLARIENFLGKYGILTLIIFAFVAPFTSYDIVAFVVGGFSKMKYKLFLPLTFLCRIIHLSVVYFAADIILKLAGLHL